MRKIVGIHTCKEALKFHSQQIHKLWIKNDEAQSPALASIIDLATSKKIKIDYKPKKFFDAVSSSHQGVCIETSHQVELKSQTLESNRQQVVLLLDGIEDPHNLGAILRTSWILGVKAIFTPDRRAASLTPTVAKVSCGGSEHIPLVEVKNLKASLLDLKEKGFWVYGLEAETSQNFWQTEFSEKVALVVGSEGRGLRESTRKYCDQLISIPQVVAGASLNASVATATVLMEVCRQHR